MLGTAMRLNDTRFLENIFFSQASKFQKKNNNSVVEWIGKKVDLFQ